MDESKRNRILRQHVQTDQLLGVESVPRPAALHAPASKDSPQAKGVSGSRMTLAASTSNAAATNSLDRETRIGMLQALDVNEVRGCTKCTLCEGRTQTVFGEGDCAAKIMFIGEGPGQSEDEQGRPFVGRAGELLNRQIAAMGLKREQVYIANVVKCRPPKNRAPTPQEVDACCGYLHRQIQIILPQVIITLGSPATKLILNTKDGITRIRGQWFSYDGLLPDGPQIPVMPTFHPAYLLRSYTEENRRRVWSDLQKVMERIGLE